MLRTLLIAGTVALMTTAAHSGDALFCSTDGPCKVLPPPRIQLPEAMLGKWCIDNHISTKSDEIYFRPNLNNPNYSNECVEGSTIIISQIGYETDTPGSCLFDKIK